MRKLTDKELTQIQGGSISSTMVGYIVRGINSFLDIGRSLGTAIRRIGEHNICPLN